MHEEILCTLRNLRRQRHVWSRGWTIAPEVNNLLACPARIVRGAMTEMNSKAPTEARYLAFVLVDRDPEPLRNAMMTITTI